MYLLLLFSKWHVQGSLLQCQKLSSDEINKHEDPSPIVSAIKYLHRKSALDNKSYVHNNKARMP